jgi:hypothetical protein
MPKLKITPVNNERGKLGSLDIVVESWAGHSFASANIRYKSKGDKEKIKGYILEIKRGYGESLQYEFSKNLPEDIKEFLSEQFE